MLKNQDQIEIALMSALVAESVLQLVSVASVISAKRIMSETVDKLLKLDEKVKKL